MATMARSQALSDDQVDELLNALLDFHSLLTGLSNSFQSRLAQIEQQFTQERAAAPVLGQPVTSATMTMRLGEKPIEEKPLTQASSISLLKELEDEVFEPESGEEFAIVDFEDDEDF
ncbi:MAG: hypothetical protein AB7I41_10310 [Candidatus Sericytochromatia bacterium]